MVAGVPGPSTMQESSSCPEVDEPDLDAIANNEEEEGEHDNSPANQGMFGKHNTVLQC